MGLLFGSAGAHTYPKSGQVAPPPLLEIITETSKQKFHVIASIVFLKTELVLGA